MKKALLIKGSGVIMGCLCILPLSIGTEYANLRFFPGPIETLLHHITSVMNRKNA
jgi:hypothetical protein